MDNITYGDLEKKVLSYTPFDVMQLRRAYDYAKNHHDKQKRASGEPYIIHPLYVAYILANKGMNVIDCGTPVLSMHSPYEVTSKFDIYMSYKAYYVFMK